MRIKFTRAYKVKPDGPEYKQGQVVEVSEASAQHFINRRAAVEAGKEAKGTPATEEEAPAPVMTEAKARTRTA